MVYINIFRKFMVMVALLMHLKEFAESYIDISTINVKSEDRISKDVTPLSYEIFIETNISIKDFNGMVLMYIKWTTDSKKIYLHTHSDLYIEEKQIKLRLSKNINKVSSKNVPVLRGIRLPKKTIYVVHLKEIVRQGSEGVIEIPFKGKILNTAQGFFEGYYTNSSTLAQESYLATNLKPNNARRLFPCFDEPEIKVSTLHTCYNWPKYLICKI
ncbi:aminopeptidase M1 isoform X2 [Drosophila ananassae]|uniref:aminopeptidase M1 isoform X2 n=1 Tax=Drosophila ananassae TaxID=7217 RepID=UPI001CFFDAF6|nr:aminopeptidase M1 isoform X2 [Drosophila ananassae]